MSKRREATVSSGSKSCAYKAAPPGFTTFSLLRLRSGIGNVPLGNFAMPRNEPSDTNPLALMAAIHAMAIARLKLAS